MRYLGDDVVEPGMGRSEENAFIRRFSGKSKGCQCVHDQIHLIILNKV